MIINQNDHKKKVSIVIPVFNGSDYLKEAIESALAQDYENIEIIVVNDGSNDGGLTKKIAESFGNRIRYFEKENGGTSSALNYGIEKMKGEYFAWLSHDDIYLPNRISSHMKIISEHGSSTIVHSNCWKWFDNRLYPFYEQSSFYLTFWKSTPLALVFGMINGLSLTFHRRYFERFGHFDEQLRTTQDYMKWYEMFRNEKIINIDGFYVKNRIHSNQQGSRISDMWLNECEDLFSRIVKNLDETDALAVGCDFYTLLGMVSMRLGNIGCIRAAILCEKKLKRCEEPYDALRKRSKLKEERFGNASIYLYCMGKRGKTLLRSLYLRGIDVEGVSDKNVRVINYSDFNVHGVSPDDIPKDSLVIVTKENPCNIMDEFRSKGYERVISYDDILIDMYKTPIDRNMLIKIE